MLEQPSQNVTRLQLQRQSTERTAHIHPLVTNATIPVVTTPLNCLRCHRRGLCCVVVSQRQINHTDSQHVCPQAVVGYLRRIDHTTRPEALPLVASHCGTVGIASAGRAQSNNRHGSGVCVRQAGNRPLVQLGLFGSTDRILIPSVSSVLACLLQLGIGGFVSVGQQIHTQVHGLPECRDLEHSTSQPRAVLHRLDQGPHGLQVLGAHLLVLAGLFCLLGNLLQLADRRLKVLQLALLVHQLDLGLPNLLDALSTLIVERGHLGGSLLLDGVFARSVIASSTGFLDQIFNNQETLPPLLLKGSSLLFTLFGRESDGVLELPVTLRGTCGLMGFDGRRRDGGGRVLFQLQRSEFVLPGLRDARLQSTRRSDQSPGRQRSAAGRHSPQKLQLPSCTTALLRSLFDDALEH
mmetsp:Transcript_58597/g.125972  ORF Transcript_58597/g.125972 Transcript_58597/m.125972 type:complete len:408 (+) Transcript_58597:73-1296(+)